MAAVSILPKDVPRVTESQGVKLFGKWDAEYARIDSGDGCRMLTGLFTRRLILNKQCRSEGHFAAGLHPSSPCRLLASHRWTLRQKAIQKGSDAYR
jgi:hypothetical protein